MKLALAAALILSTATAVRADEVAVDPAEAPLAKLATAAKCSDKASPWRPWCIATDWAKGAAPDLPAGKVLVGLTIELENGKDFAQALSDRVSFSAFAIGRDGKVKLASVTPSDDKEKAMMAEAVMNTAVVFKGKAKTAKLPKDLAGYLKTIAGAYKPTRTGGAWSWTGERASRARKVGDVWVVIESHPKGTFATILTESWE